MECLEVLRVRLWLAGISLLASSTDFLGLTSLQGRQEKVSVLRTGSSGSLTPSSSSVKEADAIETLAVSSRKRLG